MLCTLSFPNCKFCVCTFEFVYYKIRNYSLVLNLFQSYSVVLFGPSEMRLLKNETLKVCKDAYQQFVHVSSK